jgi:hypothetical protein
MSARDLYERDFFEWTRINADLLRAGRLAEADLHHIAEEIEDMGVSQRRELESRIRVLITHLLKWQFQPERRERSTWKSTIRVQRLEVESLLRKMPSLKNLLAESVQEVYERAAVRAAAETRLPEERLPKTCPYTLHQIRDRDFFPS